MRLLLITLFTLLMVVLLIFINTNGFSKIIDNTKKRTMITTIIIMECLHNETQCITKEVYTNETELGNVSRGEMRTTKL